MVEIAHSGAGIPPKAQAHIFEPFFTTKLVGQGTGLGLDAANCIVAKHRGTIRFESRHGRTAFQVHLLCSATEPRLRRANLFRTLA